ncbi:hypothetical protein K505DRAFT_422377 [Melanomma pulvis-pyrius CBS 109.77]|uniref:Uncharacterized protein n=1 Tax=Melanomma pulvis-pyrius CBS 109.77 TaxID=1314802 RepID=A0A6A6WRG2_9PLEO|nr:hypothetical protein K505DRAFT_422377 [Melanomma pulvis-pyrius CBS 109.77]
MSDPIDLFGSPPLNPSTLRSSRSKSKSKPTSNTTLPTNKPADNFTAPNPTSPYTIHHLTITTPHTDTFTTHGPTRTFAALLPTILTAITSANSPSALKKLAALSATPSFADRGFTTFVIDLERGAHIALRIERHVDAPVFHCLPAPVYVVTARGPLRHDMGSGQRTVASGRARGVARTSRVVGTWVDGVGARRAARAAMEELVRGVQGVMRSEGGEGRSCILLGMNVESVWEVCVRYDDDVLRGAVGRGDGEGGRPRWRV